MTDNHIDKLVRILKVDYTVVIVVVLAIVAAYELEWLEMGGLIGNDVAAFWLENTGILLMIALLPLALKMFKTVIQRKGLALTYDKRLALYLRMSRFRLGLLWFVCLYNVVLYYETLNDIGAMCALVAFLSMLFCIPGKQKINDELTDIDHAA